MALLDGDISDRGGKSLANRLHVDLPLLAGLLVLSGFGLLILYSASGQSVDQLNKQVIRLTIAFFTMFFVGNYQHCILSGISK